MDALTHILGYRVVTDIDADYCLIAYTFKPWYYESGSQTIDRCKADAERLAGELRACPQNTKPIRVVPVGY